MLVTRIFIQGTMTVITGTNMKDINIELFDIARELEKLQDSNELLDVKYEAYQLSRRLDAVIDALNKEN